MSADLHSLGKMSGRWDSPRPMSACCTNHHLLPGRRLGLLARQRENRSRWPRAIQQRFDDLSITCTTSAEIGSQHVPDA